MKILAIETSCDDTGIAILKIDNRGFSVLTNLVSSQIAIHAPWGGVVPSLAKREHQKSLVPLLFQALKQAKLLNQKSKVKSQKYNLKLKIINKILDRETELLPQFLEFIEKNGVPDIDAIAVTQGPGLEPALWVGVNFARALSFAWDKPLIAVSHLEGHIFANLIGEEKKFTLLNPRFAGPRRSRGFNRVKFPAITLLVSGGHTQLILIKKLGQYKLLGETLDDAAGEAFDKVAKLLGLPYPGGPEISKLAEKGNPNAFKFPRPMLNKKNHEFSFSGLKTAVLYEMRKLPARNTSHSDAGGKTINQKLKTDIAASFQQAAIEVLVKKTMRAAKEFNVKTVMVSGGVAANQKLRLDLAEVLKKEMPNVEFLAPSLDLCADNALMITLVGYFHQKKSISWQKLTALANLNFK